MAEPTKAVFLSYASEDSEAAGRIAESLRGAGIEVWLDQEGGLEHGDEWDAKIRRQIKECVFFPPIISINTESRHEGYFRIEWELACDRAMGFAHNVPFILPIAIDDTDELFALVPERFRRLQWTRLPGGVAPPEVLARFLQLWRDRTSGQSAAIARSTASRPPMDALSGGSRPPMARPYSDAVTWAPATDEKSVAVLPFANMSGDPANEYFSDGMTEEIINALVHVPELRVSARTSSFAFKGKAEDLRTIAAKLNVRTVLEGSVRKAGNRIRISAQLINAVDGFHLWSERFDRDLDDVFAVQDEIAHAIVGQLKIKLAGGAEQALVTPPTENLEAYQLYLQGRFFWNQRGAGLGKGLQCFQAALALDPNYALAHTGVADSYTLLAFYGFVRARDVAAKAREAAERAVALDPKLAEAHAALAFILFSFERNLPAAQRAFDRALELKPSYVPARNWYASLKVAQRRFAEAVALDEEAVRLEPFSLFGNVHLAWMLLLSDRTEEAVRRLLHVLELEPNFLMAHWLLGQAYVASGRFEEGLAELRLAASMSGNLPWMAASVGCALAHMGRKEEAQAVMDELVKRSEAQFIPPIILAIFQCYFGDDNATLAWLEKSLVAGDVNLPYVGVDVNSFSCVAIPRGRLDPAARAAFVARLGIDLN